MFGFFRKDSLLRLGIVPVVSLFVFSSFVGSLAAVSNFFQYAEILAADGIISEQSAEGGYRLYSTITRAEMMKVAVRLAGLNQQDCNLSSYRIFPDVGTSLGNLCGYIEAAANAGIVRTTDANGNPVLFRPNAPVSRAEMSKILITALNQDSSLWSAQFSDVDSSLGDLTYYIGRVNEFGCAGDTPDNAFRPRVAGVRGEVFQMAVCLKNTTINTTVPNGVDGSCGWADGNTFSIAPTTGLCTAGVPSVVAGNGPWTWACFGIEGGVSVACNSRIITSGASYVWSTGSYGICSKTCGEGIQSRAVSCRRVVDNATVADSYCTDMRPVTSQLCNTQACSGTPVNGTCNTATTFACTSGTSVSNVAGSCGGNATWSCNGLNGGTNTTCSKANPACNGVSCSNPRFSKSTYAFGENVSLALDFTSANSFQWNCTPSYPDTGWAALPVTGSGVYVTVGNNYPAGSYTCKFRATNPTNGTTISCGQASGTITPSTTAASCSNPRFSKSSYAAGENVNFAIDFTNVGSFEGNCNNAGWSSVPQVISSGVWANIGNNYPAGGYTCLFRAKTSTGAIVSCNGTASSSVVASTVASCSNPRFSKSSYVTGENVMFSIDWTNLKANSLEGNCGNGWGALPMGTSGQFSNIGNTYPVGNYTCQFRAQNTSGTSVSCGGTASASIVAP